MKIYLTIKSLLLVALILAFKNSFASNLNNEFFCTKYKNILFVKSSDNSDENNGISYPKYECSDFNDFDRITSSLVNYSSIPINKLTIFVNVFPVGNAHFKTDWNSITIGFRRDNLEQKAHTLVVYAHEVGHAIFNAYLSEQFDILNRIRKILLDVNQLTLIDLPFFERAFKDPECKELENREPENWPTSNSCAKFIKNHISSTSKIRRSIQYSEEDLQTFTDENTELLDKISTLGTAPYHELFADLLTVIHFNDPEIIAKSLKALLAIEESDLYCRTFNKRLDHNFSDEDAHCALSKIRVDLWEKWITPRLQHQNKSQVIQEIAVKLSRLAYLSYKRSTELNSHSFDIAWAEMQIRQEFGL